MGEDRRALPAPCHVRRLHLVMCAVCTLPRASPAPHLYLICTLPIPLLPRHVISTRLPLAAIRKKKAKMRTLLDSYCSVRISVYRALNYCLSGFELLFLVLRIFVPRAPNLHSLCPEFLFIVPRITVHQASNLCLSCPESLSIVPRIPVHRAPNPCSSGPESLFIGHCLCRRVLSFPAA